MKHGIAPKIPRCSGPDSHNEQTPALKMPLQTELWFHSRRYEQPPHRRAYETTTSRWLVATHSCSSDNDLRSGRPNNSSDDLRADAAAIRPSPTSPLEGRGQAIKAKEPEARSADGADDLVGDEAFSSCHHLSTDDGSHLPTGRSPLKSSRTGEHRPPRGGVMPEQRQDSPRTRTPPWQRATSWTVPRCARRNSRPYDGQIATLRPAVGGGTESCARASEPGMLELTTLAANRPRVVEVRPLR
jgi:hypothetical protein